MKYSKLLEILERVRNVRGTALFRIIGHILLCLRIKTEETEIYKEALKKICSMMHDHDYYPPPSPDFMSDTHQLEACCRIAGEALDRVRGTAHPKFDLTIKED